MSNRNLRTPRSQVFGDVAPGTKCRICGRNVDDGRRKTCSEYCDNIQSAVMGLLNWTSVRRRVIDRDDATCQSCGYDMTRERRARDHIRGLVEETAGERPESPPMSDLEAMDEFDWDEYHDRVDEWRERKQDAEERYGDPYAEYERALEVDHIQRIADGGHPFDPGNLQTLCSECHGEKTARENSEHPPTPTRGELSQSILDYASEGGDQ